MIRCRPSSPSSTRRTAALAPMKTPLTNLLPTLVALLALPLLAGCPKQEAAKAKDELPIRPVRVAAVETGARVEAVELVGELQGIEEIRVFAQVAERIVALPVKEGATVKRGDLLAVVESTLQSEGLRQAEAAVEAATANRDMISDNLKRTRVLVEGGSATRSQLETLETQLRAAEAQLRQATAAVGSASAQQGRTTVRSPIAGVVAQLTLRPGDMLSPTMPLATIVRDERVKAVLRVPERHFLRIREGMKVRVSPLAQPETSVEGAVTLKGPVVDRMTRTGLVEVHLANADRKLVAGSAVRVTVELDRKEGVVLVPSEAVILTGETERTGRAVAFVTDGKLATRREVRVGVRQGDRLEIVEGLAAGDRLIVQGVHLLRENNPITLVSEGKRASP